MRLIAVTRSWLAWLAILSVDMTGVLTAQAGAQDRLPRIGVALNSPTRDEMEASPPTSPAARELVAGLAEYGYVHGKNVRIVWRSSEQRPERIPAIVDELVALPVDILVTSGNWIAAAAKKRTRSIPIVMASSAYPVESGLVGSLARPGANVTGLSSGSETSIMGKKLELLKQVSPRITHVGVVVPVQVERLGSWTSEAAAVLGLKVSLIRVSDVDVDERIAAAARKGVNGLLVTATPFTYVPRNQDLIQAAALKHRLPAIYSTLIAAEQGGLMTYANDEWSQFRRAAYYVDRILKGAKPGELPIEQPIKLRFEVNLRTAKELGITIPPAVLAQADRVIE